MDIPQTKQYREQREHIIQLQRSLIESAQLPTCTTCEFWNAPEEKCVKWQARPPLEVILTGCVEYTFIPF